MAMPDEPGRVTMRSLAADARSPAEALKEGPRRVSALADTTTDAIERAHKLATRASMNRRVKGDCSPE